MNEEPLCVACLFELPLTDFHTHPLDNDMAKRLWGRFPVERATALFHYHSHSLSARILYSMKYGNSPLLCRQMGKLAAGEAGEAFFSGIDALVYVPLTRGRQRERGYNQCQLLAEGISSKTSIPVLYDALVRNHFTGSQTRRSLEERLAATQDAFTLGNAEGIEGRHLLLVDDVMTTGATLCACADALLQAKPSAISVMVLAATQL